MAAYMTKAMPVSKAKNVAEAIAQVASGFRVPGEAVTTCKVTCIPSSADWMQARVMVENITPVQVEGFNRLGVDLK